VGIELTTLPSGIRVVTEAVPGGRSVSAGVWVGVGARDEPAELAGVSHFLEHLLFKGTASRTAKQIAEAIDRVGGDMNAFTAKEYTAYYTRLPASSAALALDVLGDIATSPRLDDADVESERQVILEELGMDEDAHDDRAHTLLYESLFPGHALGRETAGERATVEAITPDDVRSFFAAWYRPANMVVAVAGAIEHDEVVAQVQRAFRVSDPGSRPARAAPVAAMRPLAVIRRSCEQVHLVLGFRGLDRDDPGREPLDVMNHVLGGGMSSRLFDEIREKRGLAYSVYSGTASYADAGALAIYAGTSPGQVDAVLDLVDIELDRLRTDGITDDELDVARGYLTGSYVLGLEDSGSRMSRLGAHVLARGVVRPVDEQIARYEAVTHDDVAKVIDRVLGGPRTLAAVGPVTKKALAARAG
jgi:predicted Zn-dependent peptidase